MWLRKDAIICLSSSVGKSACPISRRSKVRILPSVPVTPAMISIPDNQSDVLFSRGCKLERIIVTVMPWVTLFAHFYISFHRGPEQVPKNCSLYSGVEQLVACLAHNQKVVGSNPTPAPIAEQRSGLSRRPHKAEIVGSNPTSRNHKGAHSNHFFQK